MKIRVHHRIYNVLLATASLILLNQTVSSGAIPPVGLKPADRPRFIVSVKHYSLEQGLPIRGILDIEQDYQGFIWLGTFDNAYRFDGDQFQGLVKGKSSSPNQLPLVINAIRSDSAGNLWFFELQSANRRGIKILSPGQQHPVSFESKFHKSIPFSLDGVSTVTCSPSIKSTKRPLLFPTKQGAIWRYKGQGNFERIYQHPVPAEIMNLFEMPNRHLLLTVITQTQKNTYDLVEIDSAGRVYRQVHLPAHMLPFWSDNQGIIYLHRFSGVNDTTILPQQLTAHSAKQVLFQLSPEGKLTTVPITFERNPFPNSSSYDFTTDQVRYDPHHELFWYVGKNTLFAWNPTQGIVFDLAASGFPIGKISLFTDLYVDRTGVVWVITQNGFLTLTLHPNRFQNHLSVEGENTVRPRLSTRGIVQIGDWLWVNGLDTWVINLKTGQSKKVSAGHPENRPWLTAVNTAVRGHDGYFWGATEYLVRVNPSTFQLEHFPLQGPNFCWAMWQDGRHNFWLGYDQGLSIFNWQKKKNEAFTHYNQFTELAENRVNGFFPDAKAGGIWLASSSGLYLLDTLRGITAHFSTRDALPHRLPFDHITFLHPDPDQPGIYWLATRGGGLIRWNRSTGHFRQFTQADGLPDNTLYAIYEDSYGRLWLPSNYGLISFQKKTGKIRSFLPKDGVAHEEFNLTSHFRAQDGRLYLGGLNGITSFRPDEIVESIIKPAPLVITQFQSLDPQTGNMVDQLTELQTTRQIVMRPADRSFLLAFSALNYQFINETRLWYRISGWQSKWTVQNHHDLRINRLPPGNYQLQVRAQNANGQWISNTLTIPIQVIKPFYLRVWFLTLCALILIGITALVSRWRHSRLKQEKKQLEAEVVRRTAQIAADKAIIEQQAADLKRNASQKSRFFDNVTHEFRTPLTLLLGPLASLTRRITDPDSSRLLNNMERNAKQLLELVNDLLALSKVDAGQMQLTQHPTDVHTLLARTVAAFESQADFTGIRLSFSGSTQPLWLAVDVQKVETVIKNLLSNALRFTPAGGQVHVSLRELNGVVRVIVQDTGVGISPEDLPHIFERYYQSQQPDAPLRGGTGIGLALAREYCQLWGGRLTVDSKLGEGSTFAFTYPKNLVTPPDTTPVAEPRSEPTTIQAKPPVVKKKETILLVEDNPDMVTYLEILLTPFYDIHVIQNGLRAWKWLQSQPASELPSLIISDVMMPEMDGLGLITKIRERPYLRTIPVIMLTARANLETRLQALRLGVADYLTKPFEEEELLTRVSNLLERARERTAWQQQSDEEQENVAPTTDELWLQQIQQQIQHSLSDQSFQISTIAEAMHCSERQLYRKVKELTGLSPNQFIQEIKLQTAHDWLENRRYGTVKEVCHAVGFQQVAYFSRLFQQRFGVTPGALLK